MLKGRPHLCQYMPRRKDARRQVADPTNEPNFYAISSRYPLTETPRNATETLNTGTRHDHAAPVPMVATSSSSSLLMGLAPPPPTIQPPAVSPILTATTACLATTPSNEVQRLLASILQAQKKQEEQRVLLALALFREQQNFPNAPFSGLGAI